MVIYNTDTGRQINPATLVAFYSHFLQILVGNPYSLHGGSPWLLIALVLVGNPYSLHCGSPWLLIALVLVGKPHSFHGGSPWLLIALVLVGNPYSFHGGSPWLRIALVLVGKPHSFHMQGAPPTVSDGILVGSHRLVYRLSLNVHYKWCHQSVCLATYSHWMAYHNGCQQNMGW